MTKRNVFYSFHYDNDVGRVQLIRNMGVISGNEPVDPNDWERIKRQGDLSIKQWIDKEIAKSECVIVLIGSNTYLRNWVQYEIMQAWTQRKALLGIYIHNLKDFRTGMTCVEGFNPFDLLSCPYRGFYAKLSNFVRCYNPNPLDAYNDINQNLAALVEDAIANNYKLSMGRF